jgi:dTDP-glucose 4,6-dehydratase
MPTTILVTGGAGFIAHHVIDKILSDTDWRIVSLDRLDYSGNLNRLHEVVMSHPESERKRVRVIHHDLKAEINPQIAKTIGKIDYVAHLAAGSHVDRSIDYPLEFVMDNVVGTTNILNYAKDIDSLEKFVYFSTDEVFGPAPHGVKYSEYDRYNSTNPYSASKAGGEEMAVAFENTYGMPIMITHTMNVFGERQHPEKYIPMCIKRVRDGEQITVHSDSSQTTAGSRHYIHATDVADAMMFLLRTKKHPDIVDFGGAKCPKYNIVGAEELDNLELAQFIADIQGKPLDYEMIDFHSSRPGHDLRYALCGERMANMGWTPQPVKDRLGQVIDWTLENDRWLNL